MTDCRLEQVQFPASFRGLSGLQFQASVGNEKKIFFMDDLSMAWSNNTCAAGLLRQRSRRERDHLPSSTVHFALSDPSQSMPPLHCEATLRSQSGNTRSIATPAPSIPGPSPVQGSSQNTRRDNSDSSAKSDPAAETRKAVAWWLANNTNPETAPGLLHSNIVRSAMMENENLKPNKRTASLFQRYTELVTIPESSETDGQDDPDKERADILMHTFSPV
ncbi:hypothetical protein LTR28_000588 [Elasticomyces elasticus]|nr:hypothetical protein LTR28_000588 [Elasticomyces elasticus]